MRWTAALITGFSVVIAIPVAGQQNPPTVVQSETQNTKPLGEVQSGNTTIIFAPRCQCHGCPRPSSDMGRICRHAFWNCARASIQAIPDK